MNRSFLKYACLTLILVIISGSVGYMTGRNAAVSTVTVVSPIDGSGSSFSSETSATDADHDPPASFDTHENAATSDDSSFSEQYTDNGTLSEDDLVYITSSGTKYHKADCAYLKSSKTSLTLSEVVNDGYEPCSRCFSAE